MNKLNLLDFLVPPCCINCREITVGDYQFCANCWKGLTYIINPFCKRCGHPLEVNLSADLSSIDSCDNCSRSYCYYDQTRSACIYNDLIKKLIIRFKHGDGTYLAPTFARWLKQCGEKLILESDYIIPVPLHWKRLLHRRYNQSALIGLELLKLLTHKPLYAPYMLRRKKSTLSQGHQSYSQRQDNMKDAFIVPDQYQHNLKGKTVTLIDDVVTTGATLQECSKALKKAGCEKVYILTVARAVKGS